MKILYRIAYSLIRLWWRVGRPLTLGVKLIMIKDSAFLLVRHTYQEGWYLPGGAVKKGESAGQAAVREAFEEVGAALHNLTLEGAYSNFSEGKSDHILVFSSEDFSLEKSSSPEIEQVAYFQYADLPPDISPATKRRLQEYIQRNPALTHGAW